VVENVFERIPIMPVNCKNDLQFGFLPGKEIIDILQRSSNSAVEHQEKVVNM